MTAISNSLSAFIGDDAVSGDGVGSVFAGPKQPAPYEGDEESHYAYRMSRQARSMQGLQQKPPVVRRDWSSEQRWTQRPDVVSMSCINCRCSDKMACAGSSDPVCSHCTSTALGARE